VTDNLLAVSYRQWLTCVPPSSFFWKASI